MAYPKIEKNEDPTLLKITTQSDEIKELNYKTQKHDHENLLKSLKTDNESYRRNCRKLNKKKYF